MTLFPGNDKRPNELSIQPGLILKTCDIHRYCQYCLLRHKAIEYGIMFVVDDVLISDDLVEAAFSCNLSACLGACCVQGAAGAPLEKSELKEVESVLETVRPRLRPEALKVIEKEGVWEELAPGHYATTCVGEAECVFVRYDGPVAKCAIQEAYHQGKVSFEKPISCHLYPIRVRQLGDFEALNYEQIDICAPGRKYGDRQGIGLAEMLERPLKRKYGEDWYNQFLLMVRERREILGAVIEPSRKEG